MALLSVGTLCDAYLSWIASKYVQSWTYFVLKIHGLKIRKVYVKVMANGQLIEAKAKCKMLTTKKKNAKCKKMQMQNANDESGNK